MYEKSAFLTIGKSIDSILETRIYKKDRMFKLGKSFVDNILNGKVQRKELNEFMFGKMWDKVLSFCVARSLGTKEIDVIEESARCKVRFVMSDKLINPDNEAFMVQDAVEYLESYILMESIISISNGAGVELIKRISNMFPNVPILINAGYLYYGDYQCVDESKECYDIIDKLIAYYESIGFRNINDCIGNYEESCVLILCNDDTYNRIKSRDYRCKIEN